MAILPVSSVDFKARSNVSFARKNDSEGAPADRGMTAPLGKTVPVIVLMAMNPALLNSAATMSNLQGEEENPNLITMAEPAQNFEIDDATYVMQPKVEEVQQNYPLNVAYFSQDAKIQQIIPCTESGVKGNIVFAKSSTRGKDEEVQDVYIIRHNYKSKALHGKPPWIVSLNYHNLGGEKDFMGVRVIEQFSDGSYQEREVRLDDDSAQQIVNLLIGKTKWANKTGIGYSETNSPELMRAQLF
jgi:hypothetical protein